MIVPPEILDEIIENSRHDRKALLSLGWIAKRAFTRSRRYLFSALEFDNDEDFDQFLGLVDVPWTSFTPFVEHIHMKGLFNEYDYEYYSSRNMSIVKANLCNLKSVWVTTNPNWRIRWHFIPRHILDLIFQSSVRDLQLDSLNIRHEEDVVDLFNRLQPSIHAPIFYNLFCHYPPTSSDDLSAFYRPFRFTMLDSHSLEMCRNVWDPLMTKNLDVRVDTFYVRQITAAASQDSAHFISRFLSHIAPSIDRLLINISDCGFSELHKQGHEAINYSKCINVRKIHIGNVRLNRHELEEPQMTISMLWYLLAALPSPSVIEEISLIFEIRSKTMEGMLADLATFEWPSLVSKLRHNFRNAKIKIGVGVFYQQSSTFCLEMVRREGKLKAPEEQGALELYMVDLERSIDYGGLWREITGVGYTPRL